MTEQEQIAYDEYYQLRNDDKDFANQWGDTEEDFKEWYNGVYLDR